MLSMAMKISIPLMVEQGRIVSMGVSNDSLDGEEGNDSLEGGDGDDSSLVDRVKILL